MVTGVSEGYKKELELVGVGYRAEAKGQNLEMSLGFSHEVIIQLPEEIKVETKTERRMAALCGFCQGKIQHKRSAEE